MCVLASVCVRESSSAYVCMCVYVYTSSRRERIYIYIFFLATLRCVCVCERGNVVKNSKNFTQANGARAKAKRMEIMDKYGHI